MQSAVAMERKRTIKLQAKNDSLLLGGGLLGGFGGGGIRGGGIRGS
jgi:hypothetical protein